MDARDSQAMYGNWYDSFDKKRMILSVKLLDDDENEFVAEFPAKLEVCSLCQGHGKYVNPSIDSDGISQEEFDDDPEFRDSYFSGDYDVICGRCKGDNVEPVINEDHLTVEQRENYKRLEDKWEDDASYHRECEAERRMGC